MGRVFAQVLTGLVLAGMAIAGNVLRAAAPAGGNDLGLRRLSAPEAGAFSEETLDATFLDALRAREVLYRIYSGAGGEPTWLFLGYFDQQKEGSQVHSPRHCYPGAGWSIESEPRWTSPWAGEALRSLVVDDGVERRLVLYWYQMAGRTESDVLPLKLELTRRAFLRKSQDVVFASLSTPAGSNPATSMARLAPLARTVHEEIDRLYRERDEHRSRN